jgi:hypothetical protein
MNWSKDAVIAKQTTASGQLRQPQKLRTRSCTTIPFNSLDVAQLDYETVKAFHENYARQRARARLCLCGIPQSRWFLYTLAGLVFGPHGRFGRHESSYDGCVAFETKA